MKRKSESYNVLDIARYIINYCNEHGYGVSNLKLQKILYFVQAAFLVNINKKCFNESIEAWDFGPVVPEVYHEFKFYGNNNIPSIYEYIDYSNGVWEAEKVKFDNGIIEIDDRDLINGMIEECCKYSAGRLVEITHNQDPWINAYTKGCNNIITRKSIKKFFGEG